MLVRLFLLIREPALRRRIATLLAQPDVLVTQAGKEPALWEALAGGPYDLLVVDRRSMPEPAPEIVATIRKLPDRPEVVVLQQEDDAEDRIALLAAGCLAAVFVGLADDSLSRALHALIDRRQEAVSRRLQIEQPQLESRLSDFAAASAPMQRLLAVARRLVASDSSLLILGETGVGKEWLARAIHAEGPRGRAPFIAINCAAVPDSLLESELFGHEKGAFTGAARSRRGYFELAHRGTVFLDEIADMSPHLQAKLLRVIQERRLQRVGAEDTVAIDVRIMAATNRNLEEEMSAGSFRRDLFYRLSVVTLTVPPLRDRRADIPSLAESYCERFAHQLGVPISGFEPEAVEALSAYSWPGNVRELINVIERTVLLCQSPTIGIADLPENISSQTGVPVAWQGGDSRGRLDSGWLDRPLRQLKEATVTQLERRYLEAQLQRCRGRINEVAARSGLTPRGLHNKLKRLGLRKEDFR